MILKLQNTPDLELCRAAHVWIKEVQHTGCTGEYDDMPCDRIMWSQLTYNSGNIEDNMDQGKGK